jgi:hypothetical protein
VTATAEVEAFVRRYFDRRAGPLQEEEPGVFRASLPESLRTAFDGADSIRISFDPATAAAAARVDLVAEGSYLLDRIIEDATRSGWHTVARVEAPETPPAEVISGALRPRNATVGVDAASSESVPHLLFNFRVRLMTDERVDRFESVLIDTRSGKERRPAQSLFDERLSLPEGDSVDRAGIAEAYRTACRALEARVEAGVKAFRDGAEALRKAEVERITSYFDRSVNEVLDSKTSGAAEARAFEMERERRLAEADEKFRFVGDVELCNVRTVLLDVTRAEATFSNRGARRTIPVEFDAANLEVAPLPCEVCGASTAEPVLCFGGHLVGPECVKGCAFCDRVHCRSCIAAEGAIAPCATCRRPACPDHAEVCALSRRPYCPDHIHGCAICGRTVGPEYVARCVTCEQAYCVVCVAPSAERCLTCRSLEAAPPGDPAVAAARRRDPALAKVTKWRRASNQRFTVLLAKGLVWNQLLVTDLAGAVLVQKKVLGT